MEEQDQLQHDEASQPNFEIWLGPAQANLKILPPVHVDYELQHVYASLASQHGLNLRYDSELWNGWNQEREVVFKWRLDQNDHLH